MNHNLLKSLNLIFVWALKELPVLEVADDGSLVDFLKEEIRVKNKQLEVKDTQIAAMLERDHETNVLIRGLQNQLGDTFAMLTGKANSETKNREDTSNS